ncbi:MAG: TonB-dependent receptor [Lysobacter sp.]
MSTNRSLHSPLAGAILLALSFSAAAEGPSPKDLDRVEVRGYRAAYTSQTTRTATRTDTLLRDVPQAITVVTQELIRDQAMNSLTDVLRYVPGMGVAQGEGNRDTPVFRGNSSTADMFIDGMRDDVQYIRDLYNIEQVEALKGPNSMIFGRGGSGGVLNRVTKQANWYDHRELSLQAGDDERRRGTVDVGHAINPAAAFRVTGLYEKSGSYRDGVDLERSGFNPTLALRLGDNTMATVGYEHFADDRVADRGIPSLQGRPVKTDPSTFFGNPELSPVRARVDAFNGEIEHAFANGVTLRNRTRLADYDKYYQNVYPGEVSLDATGQQQVSIAAYGNETLRRNAFNQTEVVFEARTGALGHTLLAGAEIGRQSTDNFRHTGYFDSLGPDQRTVLVPVANPRVELPVSFRQSATDTDNHSVATTRSLYVQDQIVLSDKWQAILGARLERFGVDLTNNRTGERLSSNDDLFSPRAGLVFKPVEALSLYASYSLSHLPRAGEQLASLRADTRSLEPERFENRELGLKWDVRRNLSLSAAVYQLDRKNVVAPDPADPTRSILIDGQRVEGVEIGLAGNVTDAWSVMGGYAYQQGEIPGQSTTPAQLPRHSASLWNRYDFSQMWGIGLGAIHRGEIFAAADNAVTLPAFTRVDAAVFVTLNDRVKLQLNVENLLDERYFASAHNNNNITPGAPRSVYLGMNVNF